MDVHKALHPSTYEQSANGYIFLDWFAIPPLVRTSRTRTNTHGMKDLYITVFHCGIWVVESLEIERTPGGVVFFTHFMGRTAFHFLLLGRSYRGDLCSSGPPPGHGDDAETRVTRVTRSTGAWDAFLEDDLPLRRRGCPEVVQVPCEYSRLKMVARFSPLELGMFRPAPHRGRSPLVPPGSTRSGSDAPVTYVAMPGPSVLVALYAEDNSWN